jgi:hypothetical protein
VSAASYTKFDAGPDGDPRTEAVTGYSQAWKQFEATGAKVAVIRDNPDPQTAGIADIDSCVASNVDDLAKCSTPRPGSTYDVQVDAAARSGATLVDMTDYFCNATTCPPVIGGVLVYQDLTHLTATYVKTLAPYLRKQLDQVVSG